MAALRHSKANSKRFPHVDRIIVGDHAQKLSQLPIDQHTYIMVVTQGNEFDFECLRVAINANAGYLGVISSRAKRVKFFGRLKKMGVSQARLNRVKIPAGVDIGAQTPEEIAISIAAEMVAVKNAAFLGTDKFRAKRKSDES